MVVRDLLMLHKALEMLPVGVTITDPEGTILFVNSADAEMHGYTAAELLGKNARVFSTTRHWKILSIDELKGVKPWRRESVNRKKDRTLFPVQLSSDIVQGPDGNVLGIITVCEDLTLKKVSDDLRKREEERVRKLEYETLHDPLTGLTNRVLFLDRLTVAYNRSRRRKDTLFAVILIDLDDFKQVNDTYGHLAGDQVLTGVTHRLTESLRPADTLARLGGDEFGVLLDDLSRAGDVIPVVRRIQTEINRPTTVHEHHIRVTASIGIALPTRDSVNAEELLHRADLAMYEAKKKGKAQFFTAGEKSQLRLSNNAPGGEPETHPKANP